MLLPPPGQDGATGVVPVPLMPFAPQFSGPRRPLLTTPPRRAGAVRRTTTIDVRRPDGLYGGLEIDARGRDLLTGPDGEPHPVDAVAVGLFLDPAKVVIAVDGGEHPDGLQSLVGAAVVGGFRSRVAAAVSADMERGTVRHLLLDDLVGAVLVSGVAPQHHEVATGEGPMADLIREHRDLMLVNQADICAGWATDGVMLTELAATGSLPAAFGPAAPDLDHDPDPWAWHEVQPLPVHGVRRRRRLDLGPADAEGVATVDVHFRDSHLAADGVERSVHEYTLSGSVDLAAGHLLAVEVEARVLPWRECPAALASAQRVVGVGLPRLRSMVRSELRGLGTCTHLNDVLRSLADLGALADLPASGDGGVSGGGGDDGPGR